MRSPNDKQNDENLKFKPLSEGLGLNHFVDGLPYTPTSKKKNLVQFAFPPPRAPHQKMANTVAAAAALSAVVSTPVFENTKEEFLAPKPGSILVRFMAFWVDLAVAVCCFAFIMYTAFFINGINLPSVLIDVEGKGLYLPLLLMLFVVIMSYFLVLEFSWRKTPGKAIFGLRIQSESGFNLITRTALFVTSFFTFGLGFLAGFFDARKRCWHDKFSHCEVVVSK